MFDFFRYFFIVSDQKYYLLTVQSPIENVLIIELKKPDFNLECIFVDVI